MAIAQAPRGRRRWPAYLIVGLLVLIAILWVGYWFAATRVAEAAINRVTSAPIGGLTVSCPNRALSGFPFRVDLRCQEATVADATGAFGAAVSGFWASAPLYKPGFMEATLDSALQLNVPARDLALTATWSAATATASAWLNGLSGGSAHFEALDVDNAARGGTWPVTKATAKTADASLDPAAAGGLRLDAAATGLAVTASDGSSFPVLDVNTEVVAEGVGPLGTDPAAAVLKWARTSPAVKINRFRLATSGAIITMSGTLSLSKDGLLNGSLLLGYNSIEALAALIEKIRPGSTTGDKAKQGLQGVNALSRTVSTPDGTMRQTAVTFTDGTIWLTFIPLNPLLGWDPIPPIKL